MAGLIPLMLGSGSRTSFIAPSQSSRQRHSTAGSPNPASPTTPTHLAGSRLPRRMSLSTPAPIHVIPYTKAEWRRTIAEVKRKYFGKRYRACSARCLEVLDGVKDTSQVEPVYLIYLHFYAATSIEICARPLLSNSPLRASLLQQARTHFDQASALINAAEESVLRKFRPGSVGSSRGSSCHSPSGSVSSRAWTPDTLVSSPTESLCSFDDFSAKPSQFPPKRVKKVSFSLPREASVHIAAEPIIRPDSPTLGFDDFFLPSPTPTQQHQPEDLPHLHQLSPRTFQEIELPLQTIPEQHEHETSQIFQEDEEEEEAAYDEETTYQAARSVDRCCEHLSSLRDQLKRHSSSLNQLLSAVPASASATPQSPAVVEGGTPTSTSTATTTTTAAADAKKQTQTKQPQPHVKGEAARALDRQARIERLRKTGWQRKRFDARPYEELCETVLAELH